jgi:hypothetical protein
MLVYSMVDKILTAIEKNLRHILRNDKLVINNIEFSKIKMKLFCRMV